MASTLKKQLQLHERIAMDIATRYMNHRNARIGETFPSTRLSIAEEIAFNRNHLIPSIPLNVQSPKPTEMGWHGVRMNVVPVTCRYGNGLRLCVWLKSTDGVHEWPVLRIDILINKSPRYPKTEISIEGVELYYLLCVTLGLPITTIVHRKSGPLEVRPEPHRVEGEHNRIRQYHYSFPNQSQITMEGIIEYIEGYGVLLSEYPKHVISASSSIIASF